MSHFTSIKTQIKNRDALVKALADVGLLGLRYTKQVSLFMGFKKIYVPRKQR